MFGLIAIYLASFGAIISSLRYPLAGLAAYVGLAVLRPQFIFGFAGNFAGISYWVGLAALVGWGLARLGNWQFGRGRAAVLLLAMFSAWSVISALVAYNQPVAFNSLQNLAKFAVPVLLGVTLLDSNVSRRRIFWVMVLAQGYVAFEMHVSYVIKNYNQAAEGFGGMDNNCFAAALVTMIGPAIALVIASRKWYERAAAAAAGLLILHTAMLTFSRGGMVGLLAVGVTAFVMMPKRPKYMAALLVAAIIAIRLTGPELLARYSSAFADESERDGSAQSRVDLWRDTLQVVADNPLLGVGPSNWRPIASQYGWTEGKSAHSVWMETAAELGIPGATLLLLFFLVPAARLWPIAREPLTDANRDDVAIAIGVVLSVVGFVVSAQFVTVTGLEQPYYIVMIGIAVLKARSAAAPDAAPAPAPVPAAPIAVPAGSVLAARPRVAAPAPAASVTPILDLSSRPRVPGRR